MGSGCGDPIAEKDPSSSGQLPVQVALHARSPTLFFVIIHDWEEIVNTFLQIFSGRNFLPSPCQTPLQGLPTLNKCAILQFV